MTIVRTASGTVSERAFLPLMGSAAQDCYLGGIAPQFPKQKHPPPSTTAPRPDDKNAGRGTSE